MAEHVFQPDWSSAPGRTISDLLSMRGATTQDLASALSMSLEKTAELISGELELCSDVAARLATHLGSTQEFWLRREQDFRESLSSTVYELLKAIRVPLADVRRFGWLQGYGRGDGDISACARFLGVRSAEEFEERYGELEDALAFRRSETYRTQLGALAVWFRAAELEASSINVGQWSRAAFVSELNSIRTLTRERDPAVFLPILQRRCADVGVAVVVVRAPTGCPASGAAYSGAGRKPLIILSSRYLSDDHFWFSFFHEAGHVVLHENSLIVESSEGQSDDREAEADAFASDILVPPTYRQELLSIEPSRYAIVRFARKLGVAPGIVVGQLQHAKKLRYNQMNKLKRRFRWSASLGKR